MKNYAIAYLNMAGNGFSVLEPYIHDDINSYEDGKNEVEKMKNRGFCQVTLFEYDDELPESITWNFVMEHKITT